MRDLVVYSSQSGNTRRLAESLTDWSTVDVDLFPVDEAPEPRGYGRVALGFWVCHGRIDADARRYLRRIGRQRVALFGTMGATPGSAHARAVVQHVRRVVPARRLQTLFLCQGRVDPRRIESLVFQSVDVRRTVTIEQWGRFQSAASHPDHADFLALRACFEQAGWPGPIPT